MEKFLMMLTLFALFTSVALETCIDEGEPTPVE